MLTLKKYFSSTIVAMLPIGLLLGACTTISPSKEQQVSPIWHEATAADAAQGFDADGRLAIKDESKGSYANFAWQDWGTMQNIEVKTPLGTSVGMLCQDAQGVIAQNNHGKIFQAKSVATLSQQLLGFTLPFDHLNQWIKGHWAAGEPYQVRDDGSLSQSGWLIRRQLKTDGQTPKSVELNHGRFYIKLIFDDFDPVAAPAGNSSSPAAQCALRSRQ